MDSRKISLGKRLLFMVCFLVGATVLFGAQNEINEHFKIEFQPHGVAKANINYKYKGLYFRAIKEELDSKSQEEATQILKQKFLSLYNLSKIDSVFYQLKEEESIFNEEISLTGFSHAVTQFEQAQMIIFESAMIKPLYNQLKDYIGKERDFESFRFEFPTSLKYEYNILFPEGFALKDRIKSQRFWIGPLALVRDVTLNEDKSLDLVYSISWGGDILSGEDFDFLMENLEGFVNQQKPLVIEMLHNGKVLYDLGQYSKAVNYYKSMVDRVSASPMDYCRLANCYLLLRQGSLARKIINQAAKRHSDNAMVWFARGIVYQHNESGREYKNGFNYPEAEISFRRAFELDSANMVYNNTIFNHLLYDFRAVSGGSTINLEKAKPYFRQMIDGVNHNAGHLTLAWYLDDFEAMESLLFRQGSDAAFYKESILAYKEQGVGGIKKILREKKEELKQSSVSGLIALFWGKALFDDAIEIHNYTKDWELIQDDSNVSFDLLAQGYNELDESIFTMPIDELLTSTDSQSPSNLIKRFFYELYFSDGKQYLNLEPMMGGLFFKKMVEASSPIGFNSLFEKVVKAQTLSSGTFDSRWKSFILSLDVNVTSFNDKVFDITIFSANPNPTHFWALKKGERLTLVGYDYVYPGLGEELIYLANADVDSAKELLSWVMDYIIKGSEVAAAESEPNSDSDEKEEFDISKDGIVPYYLQYKNSDPMRVGGVSLSEVLATLSALSEVENDKLWDSIEIYLEKLRYNSNPIKQKMAYKALVSYHYETHNKDKVIFYGHQFYDAFPTESLAIRYELIARVLEGNSENIFEWMEENREIIGDDEVYNSMIFIATSYLVDSSYLVQNLDEILQNCSVATQASLYNLLAWISLFEKEKPTDRDFFYARKAVELSENKNRAIIHTLATLYAVTQRSDDALKLLDKIEDISDSGLYTDSEWFLYGVIMLNFDQPQTAAQAFAKCKSQEKVDMLSVPLSCASLIDKLYGDQF